MCLNAPNKIGAWWSLSDKESEQATQEIREIPNIIEKLKEAEMDLQSGRLIDWKNLDDL